IRWEEKKDQRELHLRPGQRLKPVPPSEPSCDALAAILDGFWLKSSLGNASIDKWLGCSIDFRYGYLHRSLDWIQPELARVPTLDRLDVQRYHRSQRHVQFVQEFDCSLTVVHRRAAHKAESCERDNLADPGRGLNWSRGMEAGQAGGLSYIGLATQPVAMCRAGRRFHEKLAAGLAIVHKGRQSRQDCQPLLLD